MPAIKQSEITINEINSKQDQVISKGTIDPESQVCWMLFLYHEHDIIYMN